MKPKASLFTFLLFLCYQLAQAQDLPKAMIQLTGFSASGVVLAVTVDEITFHLDTYGNIISFEKYSGSGTTFYEEKNDFRNRRNSTRYRDPSLSVDYYTHDAVRNRDGLLQKINHLEIDYYSNDYVQNRDRKVKSIGNVPFDYYSNDFVSKRDGRIKSIGNVKLDYYSNDFAGGRDGKLKTIGDVSIDYYSSDFGRNGGIRSVSGNSSSIFVY